MWLWWVLGGLALWLLVAALLGVLIGRGIRLADRRELGGAPDVVLTGNVAGAPAPAEPRRRLPLPPIGIALAALAVTLETVGLTDRLHGETSRILSMDAPLSLPRMYVAALFAAAALVAVAGAGAVPGRRTWWTAVAVVAGLIASVKAGGTVHARALDWLSSAVGSVTAQAISALLAVAVVGLLFFLSRHERRDRRRVLGSLAGYAAAAVGLSALSSVVGGGTWSAAATYLEESGEALAGVAFVVAVLAGVAPRLVLPAGWALRRAVDSQTLDLPQHLPGRAAPGDAR